MKWTSPLVFLGTMVNCDREIGLENLSLGCTRTVAVIVVKIESHSIAIDRGCVCSLKDILLSVLFDGGKALPGIGPAACRAGIGEGDNSLFRLFNDS